MSELKATPRSHALGVMADALMQAREFGNKAKIPFTDIGLGELLLGKSPEELNEWSYGNAPFQVIGRGTGSYIPQTKKDRQQQLADTLFAGQMLPAARTARMLGDIPKAIQHGAEQFAHASAAANPAIIKNKGGNWLTGSVENALKGLKKSDRMQQGGNDITLEQAMNWPGLASEASRRIALNKWIEGPLTKYVKRDMATEGDPVRKLAEQGMLHYEPGVIADPIPGATIMGNSPLAKTWEQISDRIAQPRSVGKLREDVKRNSLFASDLKSDKWLSNMAADSDIFHSFYSNPEQLGFDHLTDELINALNPESGLPRHLLLTPEQMQQLGMEKAVRHVADINAWRAAQQAEANLAKSQSPAVHLFKEYAENNPKGLRWVELKAPEALEDTNPRQLLADQLKYEGDTMGHCVGGYCDDVASGRSRIFSLRDAKGEPHVTIEVSPQPRNIGQQDIPDKYIDEAMEQLGIHEPEAQWGREEEIDRLAGDLWKKDNPDKQRIIQIKGKQNRAPKEDYLPFVQDFVKSGKWSDVGDLQNTGLTPVPKKSPLAMRLVQENREVPEYMTDAEYEALTSEFGMPKYAEGGLVTHPEYFDNLDMFLAR